MVKRLKKDWPYLVLLLPGVVLTFIFSYMPIYGLVMAFQDYNPGLGFGRSPWIGFENFRFIFSQPQFVRSVYNTFYISIFKIIFGVSASVIFALMLNEIRNTIIKRIFQTIVYIPNFISWVIMAGILYGILASDGIVNNFLGFFGIGPIQFLSNSSVFPWTMVWTDVWKTFGFGTVVYLAAITSIDPGLYESAVIDGAGRFRQTISITLPMMGPIIMLMTVLALGTVLNAGFDQIYNLYSPAVYSTGDIIDTFVYRLGLQNGRFAIGTAVGMFKSVVSLVLISLSLLVAYKVADYKVF
ncbi:MAG: ABC transporter permease subunit [Defluviitaleaceae bacterium]|nr:ABC transporter permease subunit [Defluviitaleaceae bacterium]MCL2836194.1 ABC transporter permease subunit [Defluviitaleaceae bacterium]